MSRLRIAAPAVLAALVIVAVLPGAVAWRCIVDLDAARRRLEGAAVAHTPCGPIEHTSVGQGPVLLFVHGAGGGFDQGLAMAHELAAAGLRVLTMSRFGYLGTPLPADASAAAQADAHACLLDALGVPRAAIVGVSAGAPSSLQFALRHPQRTSALVLLVPALHAPGEAQAPPDTEWLFDTALRFDFLYWAATRLARETLIESILATPPALVRAADAADRHRVDNLIAGIHPVSRRRLGLLNDARITSRPAPQPLERVAVPTLVASARDDGYGTWRAARHVAERVPGARFVDWAQGGHVWIGHHDELMQTLSAFVRGTW